ncbi:MAG: hypothetical protein ACOCQ6_01955 [Bacteroidota bacterium]
MQQPLYDVFNEITAGDVFAKAWKIMKEYFVDVLLLVFIYFIVQLPLDSFDEEYFHSPALGTVYFLLFYVPVQFGVAYAFLQIVRGHKFRLAMILSVFQRNYLNIILAAILSYLIIGIGLLLLFIPGIIFAVRLAFVPYLTTERNIDAVSAIKTSWAMTRNHAWTIFFMGLISIPVLIGGVILLGVGIIVSIMLICVAFALVYHKVAAQWWPADNNQHL